MTTDTRDFAPLPVAAIAQQLSHDPNTVPACYKLPKRAKKSIQTASLLKTALRHRLQVAGRGRDTPKQFPKYHT